MLLWNASLTVTGKKTSHKAYISLRHIRSEADGTNRVGSVRWGRRKGLMWCNLEWRVRVVQGRGWKETVAFKKGLGM